MLNKVRNSSIDTKYLISNEPEVPELVLPALVAASF